MTQSSASWLRRYRRQHCVECAATLILAVRSKTVPSLSQIWLLLSSVFPNNRFEEYNLIVGYDVRRDGAPAIAYSRMTWLYGSYIAIWGSWPKISVGSI